MQFSYKSAITGLEVVETFNGYMIYLGDKSTGMSDGVDMFFDHRGRSIPPGTSKFNRCLKQVADEWETVEAYFGEEALAKAQGGAV